MKKPVNIARTIVKFPKSKTNQIPLRYEYNLNFDGTYYYICRIYYQNNKLISVHDHGISSNKDIIIKKYKELTTDIISVL